MTTTRLEFPEAATRLCRVVQGFRDRGWVLATSGNFSVRLSRQPLVLAMTPSGQDKGALRPEDLLELDADGAVLHGTRAPSAEARLHLDLVRRLDAGAVMHTHSVWSTLVSRRFAARGGVALEGFEMLKALSDVTTHEHREWLPIVDNAQDMGVLSAAVERVVTRRGAAHGFLIRGHGLYTWGRDLDEARRHVEALEFLLEVVARESAPATATEG
jgi:methylthioribulose-1-phosphate dehydratase